VSFSIWAEQVIMTSFEGCSCEAKANAKSLGHAAEQKVDALLAERRHPIGRSGRICMGIGRHDLNRAAQ